MRILGVDPGLKATGYGVVEVDAQGSFKPVEVGSISPRTKDAFPVKLLKIRQYLDEIIIRQKPAVMVLEKLYSHYKHPQTGVVMGHARGVICMACAEHKISLVEESPKRVRKAVVGNGNATKEQTRRVVANILKINAEAMSLDASDALALALGYAYMRRYIA